MRVAIIGDGLLGRTLAELLPDAAVLDHAAIEVTNRDSVTRALADYEVAINTAALHRLPACESDPMLARLVNEVGAGHVAATLPTVFVSTDYVFTDGGPHEESLPGKAPASVYGKTKLGGEIATLEHRGIVVRVSGLYGHHRSHKGPTFPETICSSTQRISLPNNQKFSPTYAPDAARRIVELLPLFAAGAADGIYHAANSGSATWDLFARHICEVRPWKRLIETTTMRDPLRPTDSRLAQTRMEPLPHWRLALEAWGVRERELMRAKTSPIREPE